MLKGSNIAVLIPAAGASSRMRGRDKLLEEVDGQPLLRRQADMARGVCETVIVALPPPPHPRYTVLDGLDVTPLPVPECTEGLSGTLRGSLARLPEGIKALLLILPDIPDLGPAHLQQVLEARQAHPEALIWRGATEDGKPGHPALFDAATFADFSALSGDAGGQSVIAKHRDRVQLVPMERDLARADLDTPEDWEAWRAGR